MANIEHFANWHEDYKINTDTRRTAWNKYDHWCYHRTCYGKVEIPSHQNYIAEWILGIGEEEGGQICVGIDSLQQTDTKFYLNKSTPNYGYENQGKIYVEGKQMKKNICAESYGWPWGDSIYIKLDTGAGLLEFHKHRYYKQNKIIKWSLQYSCTIKTGPKIRYRLAVCMKNASVTIFDFKRTFQKNVKQADEHKHIDDGQNNQIESAQILSLIKQLSVKELEFKQLQINYDQILQKVEECKQTNIASDPKSVVNVAKQDYSIINMNQCINSEIVKFKQIFDPSELAKIRRRNPKELKDKNSSLNQTMHCYETNIEDILTSLASLKQCIQCAKLEIENLLSPKESEYKEWDIETMLIWIENIEKGRFRKYLDVLRDGFMKSEITKGIYLSDLDIATLSVDPFNINSFPDKRDLVRIFKQLQSNEGSVENTVYH